jgi:hypothetical protein
MWRAMFLAVGFYLFLIGLECLAVERVMLKQTEQVKTDNSAYLVAESTKVRQRQLVPPEWAPWSFIGSGAVVMIYSFTIPQRLKN